MTPHEPAWWYDEARQWPWAPLLAPAGRVWGLVAARRMRQPPRYRSRLPVVAIGNFTAGGTGKTPLVRVVADMLHAIGHSPCVLTRGYGGRVRGPHWVDVAQDAAADVGDEPLMLAGGLPVMVARDRAAGARAIEIGAGAPTSVTAIIMDDGLQSPALHKDVCIVVVDAVRGLGNGRCIPAGPLRAPLPAQLSRADVLLVNRGDGAGTRAASVAALVAAIAGPTISARVVAGSASGLPVGSPVIAFAGIGAPARFFATARAAGFDVRAHVAFPDHHPFTVADAERLLALAARHGAALLTTEKDNARLAGAAGLLARLREQARVLPITLALDGRDNEVLRALLAERVGPAPSKRDERAGGVVEHR